MSDHLGKISFLDLPDVNGTNVLLDAGGTPSIQTGTLAARPAFGAAGRLYIDTTNNAVFRDTGTSWVLIASSSAGTPASPDRSVQFNNSGTFGGNSILTWNAANYLQISNGVNTVPNLVLGAPSVALPAAGLYIEISTTSAVEGYRIFFNRGAGIGGYILNEYDGSTPYLRIMDEDDDPPYVSFATIGAGTIAAPAIASNFGLRGPQGGATTGFSWRIGSGATQGLNAPEVMALDSQWLRLPSGSTAQRPAPQAGMTRYNTDATAEEAYQSNVWVQRTGVVDKSVVSTTTTLTTPTNQAIMTYTVPGGTLGTNNLLRLRMNGTYLNSAGANRTMLFQIEFGGATMFADFSNNIANNATVGWQVDVILCANNSANAQTLNGMIHIGGGGASATGITGDLSTDEITSVAVLTGTSAINSAASQDFVVSVRTNANGANTFSKYLHTIEVL
jgi:hypothetical protein